MACFEIIINVDKDDKNIKEYLTEQKKIRGFKIKYIQEYKVGDYFDGHKNNNLMLNYINPNAYFLS